MIIQKILSYLSFRKQEGSEHNFFLRSMHRINRISIFMFLIAIIVLIYKWTR